MVPPAWISVKQGSFEIMKLHTLGEIRRVTSPKFDPIHLLSTLVYTWELTFFTGGWEDEFSFAIKCMLVPREGMQYCGKPIIKKTTRGNPFNPTPSIGKTALSASHPHDPLRGSVFSVVFSPRRHRLPNIFHRKPSKWFKVLMFFLEEWCFLWAFFRFFCPFLDLPAFLWHTVACSKLKGLEHGLKKRKNIRDKKKRSLFRGHGICSPGLCATKNCRRLLTSLSPCRMWSAILNRVVFHAGFVGF